MFQFSLELCAVLPVRLTSTYRIHTVYFRELDMFLRQAVTQRDMTETLPNGLVRMPAQSLGAPDIDTLVAGAV